MPSLDTYKRILSNQGLSIGNAYKNHSDMVMEATWDSDIQSKVCYIYDYFHDDQPLMSKNMTYQNTRKTRIDAKFIITQYGSLAKDQVEYHLMFKPSQKTTFLPGDELYYYETDFSQRYGAEFPIGLYIDIPNEKNIYCKWLICDLEYGNQFIKYTILPCDYLLRWIETDGQERIKRQMWCAPRAMNSYTTGLWIDRYFNTLDDVNKIWLPINKITEKIHFTNGENRSQRIVMSVLTDKPLVWKVSKIENTKPMGITKITLDQDKWDPHRDYVNVKTGEMYADYFTSNILPKDIPVETEKPKTDICNIICTKNTIKCGGSYKLLTAVFYDIDGIDVTDKYKNLISLESWKYYINDTEIIIGELIDVKQHSVPNKIRIRFNDNKKYLTKILTVKCLVNIDEKQITGETKLEIISL